MAAVAKNYACAPRKCLKNTHTAIPPHSRHAMAQTTNRVVMVVVVMVIQQCLVMLAALLFSRPFAYFVAEQLALIARFPERIGAPRIDRSGLLTQAEIEAALADIATLTDRAENLSAELDATRTERRGVEGDEVE